MLPLSTAPSTRWQPWDLRVSNICSTSRVEIRLPEASTLRRTWRGKDPESQPVSGTTGASRARRAARSGEQLPDHPGLPRVPEQDARHKKAKEPEVPTHALPDEGVRMEGVDVEAHVAVLMAIEIAAEQPALDKFW